MLRRRACASVLALAIVLPSGIVAAARGAVAADCTALNDKVFGGASSDGARFRALKAKVDAAKLAGQTPSGSDRDELARLATSILASAKQMHAQGCKPRISATAAAGAGSGPPPVLGPSPTEGPVTTAPRSAHGCSGFDGQWTGPYGVMTLRNGSGSYAGITLTGTRLAGNQLSGTYRRADVAGTFVFTLSANGDVLGTNFTSTAGVQGQYTTMQCVGS